MIKAALDAGINFFDTAPVYGADGAGETILRDYLSERDDLVLTTKVGYDIQSERRYPGQSERPHDWRPESVRKQVDASLSRLGTDHIDLLQLHNPRIEPIVDDELWDTLVSLRTAGQVASSASRSARRSAGSKRQHRDRRSTDHDAADRLQRARAGTRPHLRARDRVRNGDVSLISRVPHASDTLSGKLSIDTVLPPGDHRAHRNRDNMLDNFEKADKLRSCGRRKPAARSVRPRSPASSRIPRSRACCRRFCRSTRYANTRTPPSCRSPTTKLAPLTSSEFGNFDHVDRYVMPLKSSV